MLIKPRWRKVLRDLWLNRNRTIVVVLSIAVGVFAVGAITSSQIILSRDLTESYLATNPAHATIYTVDAFGDELVKSVRNMRQIEAAEARRSVHLRVKTGPEEWRLLRAVAIPDYHDIEVDQISPEKGEWPPPDDELLIERAALGLLKAEVGDTVLVKTPSGREKRMRIAGLVHDLTAQMFVLDGMSYGFITFETMEWLGEDRNYNELRIRVAENTNDRDHIQAVTNDVRDKIEDGGHSVLFSLVPNPGEHPLNFLIQAISAILGALGILSLLLSAFLVVNTISALLTQQTRQIGIMKAVGARTIQITELYLVMVILFGLLALFVAVPLGVAGTHIFSSYMAGFLNFDVDNIRLPRSALLLQVAVGLFVPLIAALYPVIAGVSVTVREAISEQGLGKGRFGSSWIDRLLTNVQQLPLLHRWLTRPLLLSLRNTFRRKGRLVLTLTTLILGGAIFIAVFSVRASLLNTLDTWLSYFQYDVAAQFTRDYRVERIRQETLQVSGVTVVESWAYYNARRLRPDGSNSGNIALFAPYADTQLIRPVVEKGRWLLPEDDNAIVVNTLLLRDEPDLGLGDDLILKIKGKETTWKIVGIVKGGSMIATCFANYPYFVQITNDVNRAEWVFVETEAHTIEYQEQVARTLEEHFERVGLDVSMMAKVAEERAEVEAMFEVIVILLLFMAVLLAVIGGLGLMGTMSINVLERTREIGVMRAIGASDVSVRRVFVIEGVIIGLISWLAGALLAYPISKGLSIVVGNQFLSTPLDYRFAIEGVIIWLVVVVILAAVASFIPAWNASRLTVREVLAYE